MSRTGTSESAAARVTREHPQRPTSVGERVAYVMRLMAEQAWERGQTARDIAKAWELSPSTVEDYSVEASRTLTALGQRDTWLAMVRAEAKRRIDGADDGSFVQLSRLAIDTVGGFSQKHEVDVTVTERGYPELIRSVVAELAQAGKLELLVRALLEREDARALLTEGEAIDG